MRISDGDEDGGFSKSEDKRADDLCSSRGDRDGTVAVLTVEVDAVIQGDAEGDIHEVRRPDICQGDYGSDAAGDVDFDGTYEDDGERGVLRYFCVSCVIDGVVGDGVLPVSCDVERCDVLGKVEVVKGVKCGVDTGEVVGGVEGDGDVADEDATLYVALEDDAGDGWGRVVAVV